MPSILTELGVDSASMALIPSDGEFSTLWCAQEVHVVPGRYRVGVRVIDEGKWGPRTSVLEMAHEAYGDLRTQGAEPVGMLEVPTGRVIVSDPCYIKGYREAKLDLTEAAFKALNGHTLHGAMFEVMEGLHGFVCTSGYGDGVYPLISEAGRLPKPKVKTGKKTDYQTDYRTVMTSPGGITLLFVDFGIDGEDLVDIVDWPEIVRL